jgi:predicted AlkP superfamily phosphohydrolase/phosphomutase
MHFTIRSARWVPGILAVFALCTGACAPRSEGEVEQTLDLRRSGIPIRCRDAETVKWTVIRGRRRDRYGFRQLIPGECRFELDVPKHTRLTFRVERDVKSAGQPGAASAAITAEVDGIAQTLFEADLGARTRSVNGVAELPPGRASVTFSAGVGSGSGASTRLAWTDVVVRTRDPNFEGALPWSTDPKRALAPYFAGAGARPPAPEKRRLLMIGIDGANWELMQHLLQNGEMPALASLRGRGSWGVLRSMVVPESAMSWTAMRTGVGPGKNAVYTFFSGDSPRRSFWHLLGDRGLESVIVAVPKASPAQPLSGLLVAGWTLQPRDHFSQPPELKPHLRRAGYDPSLVFLRNVAYYTQRMRRRTEVALELLANVDWDLAFVVYEYSDTVCHRFGLRSEEWDTVYRAVDSEIATLLEATDEQTSILIVSDHGWKQYPKSVSLDAWLTRNGFPEWKTNLPSSGNTVGISAIDTPNGAAPPGGRDVGKASLDRVVQGLRDLTDPQTGAKVVQRVQASHLAFEGPYTSRAPGRLIVEMRDDYRAVRGRKRKNVFGTKPRQHHSHDGIYLVAGPGIQPGPGAPRSIFDVAPTVLRFYGIAPPADAEGRTLHDFGNALPLATPGPSYFEGTRAPPAPRQPAVSPEVEEGLRALGYID